MSSDAVDGRRLLDAVLASPEDDGPRLVYSDWLQQRGDPRGELIAVQCELHRLGASPSGEHVRALLERQSTLLRKHRRAWLHGVFGKRFDETTFDRGFVVSVRLRAAELVEMGERIFEAEPVERIELLDGNVDALTRAAVRGRLRQIAFFNVALGERKARTLFSASCFTALEKLDLTSCRLGAAGARVVTDSGIEKRFPALRSLLLANNRIGDAGAIDLAEAPVLARLRELHLGMNGIGPAGAIALARSAHLATIEHLHLWGNPLGRDGLRALLHFGGRLHADGHTAI